MPRAEREHPFALAVADADYQTNTSKLISLAGLDSDFDALHVARLPDIGNPAAWARIEEAAFSMP